MNDFNELNDPAFIKKVIGASATTAALVNAIKEWGDDSNGVRETIYATIMILKLYFPKDFEEALVDYLTGRGESYDV